MLVYAAEHLQTIRQQCNSNVLTLDRCRVLDTDSAPTAQQHGVEDAALHAAAEGPSDHVMAEVMAGCTARACQRLQAFRAAARTSDSPGAAAGTQTSSASALGPGPAAEHAPSLAQSLPSGSKHRKRLADGGPGPPSAAKVIADLPRTAAAGAAAQQDVALSQQAALVRVGSDLLAGAPTGDGAGTTSR